MSILYCADQRVILGGPGCGKTTRLLEIVEEELDAGIAPHRIAFASFTRKAANEGRDRAAAKFGLSPKQMPYFRTLHSLAFQMLGIQKSDVMQTEDYKALGEELGLDFKGDYDDIEFFPLVDTLGDRVARIEGISRIRMISLEQAWHDANEQDLEFKSVKGYADALYEYKRQRGILDFIDFIDLWNQREAALPVDIVVVDEGQDLSLQQWTMVGFMARHAARLYIGGDDDQAIFRWAGADVDRFLCLGGRREVLPVSHRLPRLIFDLANTVTAKIASRYAKSWAPRGEAGQVEFLPDFYDVDISQGTWLLLARNIYHLAQLEKFVRHFGFAYIYQSRSSLDNDSVRAALAWEALRRGETIDRASASRIARLTSWLDSPKADRLYALDDLWPGDRGEAPTWMQALDRMATDMREYIRSVKRNGESLVTRPRITISTIHGVKGGEADNVILLTDMSARTWKAMNENADDECRVFFVGLSRAKHALYVIQPKSLRYFEL